MKDSANSFAAKIIQQDLKSSIMDKNIAEQKAIAELDKQDFASNPKKENLGLGQAAGTADANADAKLVQDDDDALFENLLFAEDMLDTDCKYMDWEAAEDADDEISSDNNDNGKNLPLNIKKAKTGKEVNPGIPQCSLLSFFFTPRESRLKVY